MKPFLFLPFFRFSPLCEAYLYPYLFFYRFTFFSSIFLSHYCFASFFYFLSFPYYFFSLVLRFRSFAVCQESFISRFGDDRDLRYALCKELLFELVARETGAKVMEREGVSSLFGDKNATNDNLQKWMQSLSQSFVSSSLWTRPQKRLEQCLARLSRFSPYVAPSEATRIERELLVVRGGDQEDNNGATELLSQDEKE